MTTLNIITAWVGILCGILLGAGLGLAFHREDFLGGYGTWPRRLLRLGHISFFGLAFLNGLFAMTAPQLAPSALLELASVLLVVGAVAMPATCFLAAWRRPFRHAFAIPVTAILGAVIILCLSLPSLH